MAAIKVKLANTKPNIVVLDLEPPPVYSKLINNNVVIDLNEVIEAPNIDCGTF